MDRVDLNASALPRSTTPSGGFLRARYPRVGTEVKRSGPLRATASSGNRARALTSPMARSSLRPRQEAIVDERWQSVRLPRPSNGGMECHMTRCPNRRGDGHDTFGIPGVTVGVAVDGREIFACNGVTSVDTAARRPGHAVRARLPHRREPPDPCRDPSEGSQRMAGAQKHHDHERWVTWSSPSADSTVTCWPARWRPTWYRCLRMMIRSARSALSGLPRSGCSRSPCRPKLAAWFH